MKITKYAHACLLVEVNGAAIITDPGNWNEEPNPEKLDAILITHEHQDHLDVAQVKNLLAKHPNASVITHAAVGAKLAEEGIPFVSIEPGQVLEVNGVPVESVGTDHAAIYKDSPCRNTGYLINEELFVTGDAVHDIPTKKVRILALPTAGPWMKIAEAIDYAKAVKPEFAFPVHDALYIEQVQRGLVPRLADGFLAPAGITFIDMPNGASHEF